MTKKTALLLCCLCGWTASPLLADGPADNVPDNVRRVPKPGIEVPKADRAELQTGLKELESRLSALRVKSNRETLDLLSDVEIFHRAVRQALDYQEFFDPKELKFAKDQLKLGIERAEQLRQGKAPWTTQTGLVVRGYRSRIDNTVQPYGLVVPESVSSDRRAGGVSPLSSKGFRCDIWFHGRGETLSEVNFIEQRLKQPGQYTPAETFVLHPYGRYCNANKFAGEVDALEALESVKQRYPIDNDRISVRGFSMGGASTWQFAVHYADHWFAANPGAGFAETPEFLKVFQQEAVRPTWYERKLWHLYDCTDWAANLHQCPVIAYSGEIDKQKQAADIMEQAMRREGLKLLHIIGPQTAHKIHPDSAKVIEQWMAEQAAKGRERNPKSIHFVTYTLKYNQMNWVTVDGLREHWKEARVTAEPSGAETLKVTTSNVTDLTLAVPPGMFKPGRSFTVLLDGTKFGPFEAKADQPTEISFYFDLCIDWEMGRRKDDGLRKRHNLQGPIDDAFMDSFIFVRPTGTSQQPAVRKWVESELQHAITHWRQQFRGDAVVMDDTEINDQLIASSNLVLWGDPDSNQLLRKIADKLPIRWNREGIQVQDQRFDPEHHALIAIYPNPLNPRRYVVLNSSFTYREYDYLNNARQVPKLPDWAVVDLRTPPNSRFPGKIAAADFFGERWEVREPRKD